MNTINLIVGDWSDDGHGKTDNITIMTNFTREQLEQVYNEGVGLVGVKLSNVCDGYEDSFLSYEDWQKLSAAGLTIENLHMDGYSYEEAIKAITKQESICISPEVFARIYLFIAEHGAMQHSPRTHGFIWNIINNNCNAINIGGYGFYS